MDGNKPEKIVIGFRVRVLTDIIDAIILVIFGTIISIPLKPLFFKIGENGLWIGIAVTFLYTVILQSKIGKGQSIAKRLYKIEVVKLDGGYLSLTESFLRYIIIAMIFCSSWVWLAVTAMIPFFNNDFASMVYETTFTCLTIATFFMIALHPQKRGLHDFLAGSIVIPKSSYDREKIDSIYSKEGEKKAINICIAITIVIAVALFSINIITTKYTLNAIENVNEFSTIQKGLENSVLSNVAVEGSMFINSSDTIKTLSVSGFMLKSKFDVDSIKNNEKAKILEVIKTSNTKLDDCDSIHIIIRTGFNIGLTSYNHEEQSSYDKDGNELKAK